MPDENPPKPLGKALAWAGTAIFAILSVFTVYLALRTASTPIKVVAWVMTALNVQLILVIWHFQKKGL